LDLEKKVAQLAMALKRCQDEKKVAEETLDQSKKDLEKLKKTHDDDLRLIENVHKDHDKSSKVAEDLRTNNVDLAKSLSSKEQKITNKHYLKKHYLIRGKLRGRTFLRLPTS
jgi:chromosome segregation ATPase